MAVKFPLKMADGAMVRTLDELREHFDLTAVLAYYDNGRLTKWLENGYYDEEAKKVAALDAGSADFAKELCGILGANYLEHEADQVDLGGISKRNERLERLKQYTADDTILAAVDRVAFTQEELVELLNTGVTEVYLFGERFIIPDGSELISYIGINKTVTEFVKDAIDAKADLQGGVCWLKHAAEQGDLMAQVLLGDLYMDDQYDIDEDEEDFDAEEKAAKWYREAAEHGDATAQVRLGDCYLNGEGVEYDYEKAVEWYRKAAEQGDPAAQVQLGDCYMEGYGVECNYEKAVNFYRKAIEQGYIAALCSLGDCYTWGRGVDLNLDEAVKWYKKAAEQGNVEAQYALGSYYHHGSLGHCFGSEGFECDLDESIKWYRMAAELGSTSAQNAMGDYYWNACSAEHNYEEAEKWYKMSAKQGDAIAQEMLNVLESHRKAESGDVEAQVELGQHYLHGDWSILVLSSLFTNRDAAIKWYKLAADQGHVEAQKALHECALFDQWYDRAVKQGDVEAQTELAECYKYGRGTTESMENAITWYKKAAKQGYARAQTELGRCYADGHSTEEEDDDEDFDCDKEAVKWFEMAAGQGYAKAQTALGDYYADSGDDEEAVRWYRMAAEQGDAEAEVKLGECYEYGQGVDDDEGEAVKWYRLAAEHGDSEAKEKLEQLSK